MSKIAYVCMYKNMIIYVIHHLKGKVLLSQESPSWCACCVKRKQTDTHEEICVCDIWVLSCPSPPDSVSYLNLGPIENI